MKHLAMHGTHEKADACTVFDCLRDPMPSTSATVAANYARRGRSARGPAFTDDVTHCNWLYVGKCTDVYFDGESKYDNISAKELLKFEAGVCRIPTQNLFCCYCNCYLVQMIVVMFSFIYYINLLNC